LKYLAVEFQNDETAQRHLPLIVVKIFLFLIRHYMC